MVDGDASNAVDVVPGVIRRVWKVGLTTIFGGAGPPSGRRVWRSVALCPYGMALVSVRSPCVRTSSQHGTRALPEKKPLAGGPRRPRINEIAL